MKEHLDSLSATYPYSAFDRKIDSDCKDDRARPDFLYKTPTCNLIVEVDEHQHKSPTYKGCEVPRMINIHQSIGEFGRPCIFIRYNPHSYRDDAGRRQTPSLAVRWILLDSLIKYYHEYEPKYPLSTIHLFYDEFDEHTSLVEEEIAIP